MNLFRSVLKHEERAIYALRELYKQYGYSLYKVSKFEEYDLYARHKNFLVSQNILTFTDTNGKLLALKPDVTLSIIKNIPNRNTVMHKVCYNETVYRTSTESGGFREIMQTGLECIGAIDLHAECEVILLAMKSLAAISEEYILDISHMGLLEGLLENVHLECDEKEECLRLIKCKNVQALQKFCEQQNIASDVQDKLITLTTLYLPIQKALPILKDLVTGEKMQTAYAHLQDICRVFSENTLSDHLYVDFSIVNDVTYYDGITFKGFINGIPDSVLSGGRYDRLLHRLGKDSSAIGFAVYLDRLERLETQMPPYDVDTVLLYDQGTDVKTVFQIQTQLQAEGKSVFAVSDPQFDLRYRQLIQFTEGGLKILETND